MYILILTIGLVRSSRSSILSLTFIRGNTYEIGKSSKHSTKNNSNSYETTMVVNVAEA